MSAWLYSIGAWCSRHRFTVIGGWLAILLVLGGAALAFHGPFSNDFDIPGSESSEALHKLHMTFPSGAAVNATAIVIAPEGSDILDMRDQIEDGVEILDALPIVDEVTSPFSQYVEGAISDDDAAAMISLALTTSESPTDAELAQLTAAANDVADILPEGSRVEMGGQAFNIEVPALGATEGLGVLVAVVVLFITLGSLLAAGLPIISALISVGVGSAILFLATDFAAINSVVPLLSVMLGIAVGIDYALFILARHRDQLREGVELEHSIARAVGTAGSAVVFAGLTNIIALLGLAVAGIPFLTVMGAFASITVALTVAVALTLMPAFMGLLGERMRPPAPRAKPGDAAGPKLENRRNFHSWWVGVTTKHPIVTIVVIVGSLGALTLPAAHLQLALPNSYERSADAPDRVTYDLVEEYFGPGYNAPFILTADIIGSDDPLGLISAMKADIEDVEGVALVPMAVPNPDADTAVIQVIATTDQFDPATAELVERLRDLTASWEQRYGVDAAVTGYTAVEMDITNRLGAAVVPFGLLVVGLSLILLLMVFRSVWIALKTTVGYLLSVGAAFGATTLVFNDGWLLWLVGVERPVPVISFLPILLMGILFGLAMDYEAFLVSRMREEYIHGRTALEAIRIGFVASAPVVTALAIIMLSVFAFFVPGGMMAIKAIAFALAVGVTVDAFLIRTSFTPAVLALLGDRAWHLPAWLDRIIPSFDVEGEVLTKKLALASWPGDGSVIHAEELAVEGVVDGFSITVHPGHVVGIAGPAGPRSGLALAMSGRLEVTSGRARVAGELLPESASAVRSRTTYIDLATEPDPATALRTARPAQAIFIDSADLVGTAAERAALSELIARIRQERHGALVCCGASPGHLTEIDVDGVVSVTEATLEGSQA
ncbi:MAG: MMPL family transporter [Arachnia sp.]